MGLTDLNRKTKALKQVKSINTEIEAKVKERMKQLKFGVLS